MLAFHFPFWHSAAGERVRTPTLLQMEAVECGAVALGIMLAYFGRIVTLEELREACSISRDGSKAVNIIKAARLYGLKAKGFKKELGELRELRPPFILFWHFNHFVVVEGFAPDRVYLNDPAAGPRTVSLEEFDEAYTGVVIAMEPGPDFSRSGKARGSVAAIRERLRGCGVPLLYLAGVSLLLVIPGLLGPIFTRVYIDEVLLAQRQTWLQMLLLGMGMTLVLRGVLTWLRAYVLRRLRVMLALRMSSQFFWHILRLPVSYFAQRFGGEIASRIAFNDLIAGVIAGQLSTTVIDLFLVVFYGLVMVCYDWVLGFVGIELSLINILVLYMVGKARVDANLRLTTEYGKLAGIAISGLQNMETMKASALEGDFFARWAGQYAKSLAALQQQGRQNLFQGALPVLLSGLATAIVLWVGGLRVINGDLTIGMLVAFQSLMASFQAPVNTLVRLATTMQDMVGNIVRLDDVLAHPPDPALRHGEGVEAAGIYRLEGQLELRDVSFGYSPADPPLIEHFNLTIRPGQRVALVGGSGSGKTTLGRLISGLYQPTAGEIRLDGQPRQLLPRSLVTGSLAMVEQDVLLFASTVHENLTLWDATVPYPQLEQACRDAAIHDDILALPGGYEARLLEGGSNLSGGQRQRLEIARALVHNPSLLVMDEATSALDAETEYAVMRHLVRRGCSCVLVAHRLSTIRDCDEIIVLRAGKVVQRGTHDDLMRQGGLYAELIRGGGEG